jgi:hypothetical protein
LQINSKAEELDIELDLDSAISDLQTKVVFVSVELIADKMENWALFFSFFFLFLFVTL